jgi:hypothetical protein
VRQVAQANANTHSEYMNGRYLRKADGSDRQFGARLHAGYSFATSLRFKPVYACVRRFKNRSGTGFVHFRELA